MTNPSRPRLTLITKSYAPDYQLCADLVQSVRLLADDEVEHQIIVPTADTKLFGQLAGPQTRIRSESDLLPRYFVRSPVGNLTINLRHPYPPARGWIVQQMVKLHAAAESQADVVVIVDSDTEFVRPFGLETFTLDGGALFYRLPGGVDETLPRHLLWHEVARRLLGLPRTNEIPLPDYISSLVAWEPSLVRQMLRQVETTTRRRWADVVAAQLHFSECILYGVYTDRLPGQSAKASQRSLCHAYWGSTPLDDDTAAAFFEQLRDDDVAVMVSAKSHTSLDVRRAAFRALRKRL
jgi:hypothetical protein